MGELENVFTKSLRTKKVERVWGGVFKPFFFSYQNYTSGDFIEKS